jgi:hypothetical protein
MKKLFFIAAVFSWVQFGFAQQPAPKARVETMLAAFKSGTIEDSINTFGKNSLIPKEYFDQLKSRARSVFSPERKILGFEFIEEQNIGASVKRLTYVLKTADEPFTWTFVFYKPANDWLPLRMSFIDDF